MGGETGAPFVVAAGAAGALGEGAGQHRAHARGEDEAAGPVPEPETETVGAGDERALEAERLAGGADEHVGANAGRGAQPGSSRTGDAEGVGLVDDQGGVVAVAEGAQGGEIGGVAIHAEVGLGDHPAATRSPTRDASAAATAAGSRCGTT